jgi:hypothetical protein
MDREAGAVSVRGILAITCACSTLGLASLGCVTSPYTMPSDEVPRITTRRLDGGYLEVKNVQGCGDTRENAGEHAREVALRTALEETGAGDLAYEVRDDLLADAEDLVKETFVQNLYKWNGRYCPIYTFQVDLDEIDEIIRMSHDVSDHEVPPTLGVAASLCTLPARFEDERSSLAASLNSHLKEQFFELGFETEMSRSMLERRARDGCDDLGVRDIFVDDQLRATHYLVYGRADVDEAAIHPGSRGGYRAYVRLSIHFLSVADGLEVVSNTEATGTGVSEIASLRDAIENAAQRIAKTEVSHRVIEHWERKLRDGFTYDVLFCQLREPADWVRSVRDSLTEHGEYVGMGPNIVVAGSPRRTWRFKAEPGEFVHPGPEFVFFLEDLQEREAVWIPGLSRVEVGPRILDGRVFYMFGDDPGVCFSDGARMQHLE